MAENAAKSVILAALADGHELSGPALRERAELSDEDFYEVILQLETDRRVKSRWAVGLSPMVRLYRLAGVEIAPGA
ncbi:hypothetical protein [Geminicoccus harenae]|uniref:hypothetical protein n=1 Tax=Geminicoccus harenae TaxID=2498453 RepID=UPI00168A6AD8|nr:hypothetical protein [Geminicoccus harenae]